MMEEIWRNIEKYEGLYQISDHGRVKSLERLDSLGHLRKEKILKPFDNKGYLRVQLCKNGKGKFYSVHRLVAQAFIDNPYGLKEINHKDEDKTNNHVENLEWCNRVYNLTYGTRLERVSDKKTNGKRSKPVYQYSLDGELIKKWPSMMEVQRKMKYSHISECCNGKRQTAYGYKWTY